MLVVPNKGVPHLDWLAKYTAAFFNMSRFQLPFAVLFLALLIL